MLHTGRSMAGGQHRSLTAMRTWLRRGLPLCRPAEHADEGAGGTPHGAATAVGVETTLLPLPAPQLLLVDAWLWHGMSASGAARAHAGIASMLQTVRLPWLLECAELRPLSPGPEGGRRCAVHAGWCSGPRITAAGMAAAPWGVG